MIAVVIGIALPHRIGDLESHPKPVSPEWQLPHRIGDLERIISSPSSFGSLPHRIGDLEMLDRLH